MKALIQNNVVIGLWEKPFEVHSSFQWVDATEDCQSGWSYLNGIFSAPPLEPELTYAQKRAKAYPSIADQLDTIYHEGIDAWKATIAAVKQEYPKP